MGTELKHIELADVENDPHRFGLPTFAEFCSRPDYYREKWRGREDSILISTSKGSENLNKHIAKHEYRIDGYKCKNEEEVERIAKEQGYKLSELTYAVELEPMEGNNGKLKAVVEFYLKTQAPSERKLIYPR